MNGLSRMTDGAACYPESAYSHRTGQSRKENKDENKQKEQACKELDQNELEKVTGGVFVPVKPDEDDDNEDTNNHGGGATGGW